jgi:hypothetical protein
MACLFYADAEYSIQDHHGEHVTLLLVENSE